jgi:DNA (cytosine-5)-methyltransferase 1
MKALSLFSGIGGADLAAEATGMEIVAFAEIDPFCCKVLKKHWPDVPNLGDVFDITKESIDGAVALIYGGFPCQPFSAAGQRKGKEDDRDLWPEMLRLIQTFRPTWVVGENTYGFVSLGLDDALSDLEAEGYSTRAFVLPACAVGAYHRRDRCFIVAYADGGVQQQTPEPREESQRRTGNETEDVTDSRSVGLQGSSTGQIPRFPETSQQPQRGDGGDRRRSTGTTQPGVVRGVHGLFAGLDAGRLMEIPPLIRGRMPNRAKRIKALGNAIVPQQICPIFEEIMEVSR